MKTCFGLALQARPFSKGMQIFGYKCAEFSSALNNTKIGLILCILRELGPVKVFKVVKSEKVPLLMALDAGRIGQVEFDCSTGQLQTYHPGRRCAFGFNRD